MLLIYILIAVVLVNTGYYLLFSKFSFLKPPQKTQTQLFPVSVIVCAKNEADNLRQNIPLWLAQNHPNFELILINDASIDETKEVIESFAEKSDKIHTVNIENNEAFWSNKKYSLTLGIKRAVHQRLLFTDADCRPASDNWLREMAGSFTNEKQLVLGYGPYEKKKGFLNALIRYETLLAAVQYFSYALAGIPYMGVGRNLGYTSQLFYDNRGFMSHMNIPSGDDDLFVNEAATKENTAICTHPDAFTISVPKKNFKDWFRQKRRHVTTARHYNPKHQAMLGLYYFSTLLFWIILIPSLLFIDLKISISIILFRFLMQYIFVGAATKNLKERDLFPFLPFLELFLVFFQLSIFITNSISKPKRWK